MKQVTFGDILKARETIRPYARLTPLEQSFYLGDEDHKFYFKLESLQRARSFKIRGAVNKMLSLTEEERQRGVAAVSSGNHGSSVAYAAQLLGIDKAVIIVPECTPQSKIDKIRYFGAEVKLMGRNYDEAHALGMNYIRENGLTNIDSCHDDVLVYAGQGTVALAAKTVNPAIRVYGVQTEACPAMVASIADGVCYEEYPIGPTLCDALVGGVGALSYEMLPDLLDDILVVKEETVRRAAAFLLTEEKFVIEAGSATTVAAVWDHPEKFTGKKTALILTGGNIDGETIRKVLG